MNVIVFLLYSNIEFLSFIFLIVYVGAIAILFLFVIMLFNIKRMKSNTSVFELALFIVSLLFIGGSTAIVLVENYTELPLAPQPQMLTFGAVPDVYIIAQTLYTEHGFLFFSSGLILFCAMIGAIFLATNLRSK